MKKLLTLLATATAVFILAPATAEAGNRHRSSYRGGYHRGASYAHGHSHGYARYHYAPRYCAPRVWVRPAYCAPVRPIYCRPSYGYAYVPPPVFNLSFGFGGGRCW